MANKRSKIAKGCTACSFWAWTQAELDKHIWKEHIKEPMPKKVKHGH